MSVLRPKPPDDPLVFAPLGGLTGAGGQPAPAGAAPETQADVLARALPEILAGFATKLTTLREHLACQAEVILPARLLDAYTTPGRRSTSTLAAILATARRLRESVDRVIVLGDGCAALAGRAVFESCAHPFHNELPRGERGGRPRLSWIDASSDTDSLQGFLDLLAPAGRDLLAQWAVVATAPRAAADRVAAAARFFVSPLLASVGGDRPCAAERFVTIRAPEGPLAEFAARLGSHESFDLPTERAAESAPFTAATLLPAAVAGIDVVRLLEGAVAMNRRCAEAPLEVNPVLGFAALSVAAADSGRELVLVPASRQLDSIGRLHARLQELAPPTRVSARPRAGASVPAATGRAARVGLRAAHSIRDRLVVPPLPGSAASQAAADAGPTGQDWSDLAADSPEDGAGGILLPQVDEHAVGQLLQLIYLATLVAAAER